MRKRISCLLICLLFLCCTLFAACGETVTGQELTSGDYLYTIRDDGTAMIRKYTGQAVSVRIPSELEGVAVTAIGPSAFQANTTVIDVIIPEGIVSLGDSVFKRCSSLESVEIPASLTEIGVNPFAGCEVLYDVIIDPDNKNLKMVDGVLYSQNDYRLVYYSRMNEKGKYEVKNGTRIIGAEAFYECTNITRLKIRKKSDEEGAVALTAIGRRAFYGCENLTQINLEDTEISTIGSDAFFGCVRLDNVTFPDEIASIAERAFCRARLLRL